MSPANIMVDINPLKVEFSKLITKDEPSNNNNTIIGSNRTVFSDPKIFTNILLSPR
mgnify:CR=1 FL=1